MTAEGAVTVGPVTIVLPGPAAPAIDDPRLSMRADEVGYCVVDLETTGGSPGRAFVTEIGAVRMRGLRVVDRFSTLVDPGAEIPEEVTALTGIDAGTVAGAPPVDEALAAFTAFAGDDVLVAHNAPFDLRFLNYERRRLAGDCFTQPWIDTLELARRLLPGRVERHDLTTLAGWARTRVRPRHRALPDAEATGELLAALIGVAAEEGMLTLGALQELAGEAAVGYHHRMVLTEALPSAGGVYLLRDGAGEVLYVGAARNLRREVRGLFRPGARPGRGLAEAVDAAEAVEHERHGSRLGAMVRMDELLRQHRPTCNRGIGSARYITLSDGGRGGPLHVTTRVPARARAAFGPLRGERTARRAIECVRILFAVDPTLPVQPAVVMDGIEELLRGDPRALGALGARVAAATAAGRIDPASAEGRGLLNALTATLHALGQLRRAGERMAVLVEPGPEPEQAEGFFVCGGAVVARRILPAAGWRAAAESGLDELHRRRPPRGPLPVRLRTCAMLIEERLAQRGRHPGAVRLQTGFRRDDALAAMGRGVRAVLEGDASDWAAPA